MNVSSTHKTTVKVKHTVHKERVSEIRWNDVGHIIRWAVERGDYADGRDQIPDQWRDRELVTINKGDRWCTVYMFRCGWW